uniref:Uncharacterized protein n=1 Tax=Mus spicilegus TaxID=10103 RepID=A0A8C6G7H1_MUSSI
MCGQTPVEVKGSVSESPLPFDQVNPPAISLAAACVLTPMSHLDNSNYYFLFLFLFPSSTFGAPMFTVRDTYVPPQNFCPFRTISRGNFHRRYSCSWVGVFTLYSPKSLRRIFPIHKSQGIVSSGLRALGPFDY